MEGPTDECNDVHVIFAFHHLMQSWNHKYEVHLWEENYFAKTHQHHAITVQKEEGYDADGG